MRILGDITLIPGESSGSVMMKYIIYKIGQFIANFLPLSLSYGLATFMSDCQYLFSFRDRTE